MTEHIKPRIAGRRQNKSIDHPLCPVHNVPMGVSRTLKLTRYFKCGEEGCKKTSHRKI